MHLDFVFASIPVKKQSESVLQYTSDSNSGPAQLAGFAVVLVRPLSVIVPRDNTLSDLPAYSHT